MLRGLVRLVLPIYASSGWEVSGHVFLVDINCDQEDKEKQQNLKNSYQFKYQDETNYCFALTTNRPAAKRITSKPPEMALPLTIAF